MKVNTLSRLEWLIGEWEGIQGTGIYHEEWERVNDTEFKGKAYFIKKGEIINPEKLKLHSDNYEIYYIADVSHNPNPVSFRMTEIEENIVVFENPEHDFPQKITYIKKEQDSLLAIIEATNNDKTKKVEFNLKKI
ncbi:MAG: DUF6265 family protein [Bacteroidota bacterium]|nr:DUF6265 family protein [Bacteroidota bacterium]